MRYSVCWFWMVGCSDDPAGWLHGTRCSHRKCDTCGMVAWHRVAPTGSALPDLIAWHRVVPTGSALPGLLVWTGWLFGRLGRMVAWHQVVPTGSALIGLLVGLVGCLDESAFLGTARALAGCLLSSWSLLRCSVLGGCRSPRHAEYLGWHFCV